MGKISYKLTPPVLQRIVARTIVSGTSVLRHRYHKIFSRGQPHSLNWVPGLTHHGRRSQRARERRLAARIVQNAAWFDEELAESINVLRPEQIGILTMKRGVGVGWSVHVGQEYEKGEVIRDVRGRGSLQKVPVAKADLKVFKRMQRLNLERRLARLQRSRSVEEPTGEEE